MNILVIGDNSCNKRVGEYFINKGICVTSVPDIYSLNRLAGEAGSFTAFTKDAEVKADFVILTEQPKALPVEIEGLLTDCLYSVDYNAAPLNSDYNAASSNIDSLTPVIFLLDYVSESPMAATIRALKGAAMFSRKKRKVYYLARFIRTAGHGIESLYSEAREAGVTFIKYEELRVISELSKEEFTFFVSDGEADLEIKVKTIYTDGGWDAGESFAYAVKKLNLTSNRFGYVTEDKFFLSPALTSRRGVYHLTRDLVAERLEEGLDFIFAHAIDGVRDIPTYGSAVVDGQKCVFCYNCYRACPHAALEPDTGKSQMRCLPVACAGCGICAGLCPGNAIVLERDEIVCGGSRRSNEKLLALCCENSGVDTLKGLDGVEYLVVPCGGLIDVERLSDGLGAYSRVIVVVCHDDACRHFDGNKRACAQVSRMCDLLGAAGLDKERVSVLRASHAMPGVLKDEIHAIINNGTKDTNSETY